MIDVKNWLVMPIDDINAAGGFKVGDKTYKLDPVVVDDKFTPEGQLDAVNRLALAEKVKFIVGCPSGCASTITPVSEPAKVLALVINPADQMLGPKHPFNLATGSPTPAMLIPPLFDVVVKENPSAKRVSIVTTEGGVSQLHIQLTQDNAARLGLTYVGSELVPGNAKDLTPVVLRLLQQKPDLIYNAGLAASATLFPSLTTALHEQGFKGVLFGSLALPSIITAAGPAADGFYVSALGDADSPLLPAKMKDLANRYIAKYGKDIFYPDHIIMYDMVSVLVQAMQKAGTVDDTEKIAQALRDGQWDGVAGKGRFSGTKTFGAPVVYGQQVFVSKFVSGKGTILAAVNSEIP